MDSIGSKPKVIRCTPHRPEFVAHILVVGVASLIPRQAQTHPQDLVAEADEAIYLQKIAAGFRHVPRKNDPVSRLVHLQA